MIWNLLDEALVFALFSFFVQLLLVMLRSGSNVRIRLVMSPTQNPILNYEVRNIGNVTAKDVHVTFSRPADDQLELWNTPQEQDLRFESIAPGEVYSSMFCTTPRWGDTDPVTATVRYRSSGLFPRLMDFDGDERWYWRALGSLTSGLTRGLVPRRKSFVLDPRQFFAMRFNVGYAGKDELRSIVEELRRARMVQERTARASEHAEPPAEGGRDSLVRTEGAADQWARRRPTG